MGLQMEIWAVVLAAGGGTRFGGGKMLANYDGQTLIGKVCSRVVEGNFAGVIVVAGDDAVAIQDQLNAFPQIQVALNTNWRSGIGSSLIVGVETLPASADACLIFLGDMPEISTPLILAVKQRLIDGKEAVVVDCEGRPGHPVGIARSLFGLMHKARGDRGARPSLLEHARLCVVHTTDSGAIKDIDTRSDLVDRSPCP